LAIVAGGPLTGNFAAWKSSSGERHERQREPMTAPAAQTSRSRIAMVSVSTIADNDATVDALEAALAGLEPDERRQVREAHAYAADLYADRVLGTGEPVLAHALGLAASLAALRLPHPSICRTRKPRWQRDLGIASRHS
jgi:hypothetical protein